MANSDDVALRGEMLRKDAKAARSRAHVLSARYRDLTRMVAVTEEQLAATMDRMAARWPADAGHCRAYSQQARRQAALCRQRADPLS